VGASQNCGLDNNNLGGYPDYFLRWDPKTPAWTENAIFGILRRRPIYQNRLSARLRIDSQNMWVQALLLRLLTLLFFCWAKGENCYTSLKNVRIMARK
jgi:hypothetical protein